MRTRSLAGVVLAATLCAVTAPAGYRTAGNVVLEHESLNGGGTVMATNDLIQLSGTLGQNHFVAQSTNTSTRAFTGFWWAESACVLSPTWITSVGLATNAVAISFGVTPGSTYRVLYIAEEDGGLPASSTAWTNLVGTSFVATGHTAVVYDNLGTVTNQARYYLIRCE